MKKVYQVTILLLALLMLPLAADASEVYGDVNGDGEVSLADINSIIDAILSDSDDIPFEADVNGDGEVSLADINAVIDEILDEDDEPYVPGGIEAGEISEDILYELSDMDMNIYYGDEPPILDGVFVMDPADSIAGSGPWGVWITYDEEEDESYMIEADDFDKMVYVFQNQKDNLISTIFIPYYGDEYDPDDILVISNMNIMGHDNKFTISAYLDFYFECVGLVISGEIVDGKIKNMQMAQVLDQLPGLDIYDIRLIIIYGDGDGFSYRSEWPSLYLNKAVKPAVIKTSKMNREIKSLFKRKNRL